VADPGSQPPRVLQRHRRLLSGVVGVSLTAATLVGLGSTQASAAVQCDPSGDVCAVVPDTAQTPLGLVTVTVTTANVVTVHLDPAVPNTVVIGVPFHYPAGPPGLPGYTRTTIATTGGLVSIDTIQIPPGPPARIALPNLVIISISPPGPPCRARTVGTSVTFSLIFPPGPPA